MVILGIDIGGANTKITELEEKYYKIHHIYFPMWKKHKKLTELLRVYNSGNVEKVGIVMTAELVDAYRSKREGVEDILNSVERAFPDKDIYVFDVDGNFLEIDVAKKKYIKVSASNWTATAYFVIKDICDNCILVDMGSTTTDIIPIKDGEILAEETDLKRLMNNQLVYVGALRTPLSFLTNTVVFRGFKTNVSSEYFSITGDVNLILNKINPEDYTCDTPDGVPVDRKSCMRRVARVLCSDLEEVNEEEILDISLQFYRKLLNMVRSNLDRVFERYEIRDVVITGLGEGILKEALEGYSIISVGERYGKEVSLSTPSFAVAKLLENY
ncbi:(4-{4-[2-(gamma-L-glutamylamino)ethyl]phenoxymethyl}furan-2-yl)methanamine synthase [Methanofervidicoccus abyssi]|uniref:(4-(4-[2-(Gamma-L-glutamylamino) ethyl]phenoxymethyl)furan-2-yl)methanamine synthase n=1 Tax=Methanofervidicoccus abyssi TaxID=2082189 RepID=A0A401HQ45_9EURY|nr:(4-{4-[2-(gamma-L-glutamylamino)ethyl]phenoxymethyl}furan-2-yl)methanamine synthase [Methanofervidicoccus abyssi]GBF36340.1 (4-(4-[2-(gamma-L-glutamylamino) ethyl]phenoxymethyl)furan-2-yl)methanamine synthase [Methanofervidicoccus abyssi]